MNKKNDVTGSYLTGEFTTYQIRLIVLFVILIFTVVVDYITIPALSVILLPELNITTTQFGLLIIPVPGDRGAFMALDASLQQMAGGMAAIAAGWIVYQAPDGMIESYSSLGWIVIVVMIATIGLMYMIDKVVKSRN